jgi:5'-nucleotidase
VIWCNLALGKAGMQMFFVDFGPPRSRLGWAGIGGKVSMRFLLTNDDGIDAPGLEALGAAAAPLGEAVTVAPVDALSGCSHQVTTHLPIRVTQLLPGRYAVQGTPADCVRVGLHRLVPKTDWVLSGINAGGNLGADVYHSGTVAAVREAVLHGRPGIALSHYRGKGMAFDWGRAARWVTMVLRDLLARPVEPGTWWNVNLPHLEPDAAEPEVVFCRLDPAPLPVSFREEGDLLHYDGDYHLRRREAGTDVDVCFQGKIAVTKIALF